MCLFGNSGWFHKKEELEALHKQDTVDKDVVDRETKKAKIVAVPICKPENFGPNMAIDEKNIWGEIYTIISNRDTSKIAFMAMTVKETLLKNVLQELPKKILWKVKRVTADLDAWFARLVKNVFDGVKIIGDKFHVIRLALEALQAVRIRYRQDVLREERIRRSEHKARENKRRDECERTWEIYVRRNLLSMPRYENGETKLELLARSKYLLFKFESDWSLYQKERATILFQEFPEIKISHSLICSFRSFYNCRTWKKINIRQAKQKLKVWYKKLWNCEISEIENFASTVTHNEEKILEYFHKKETNAFAESLNNKIQRFVHQNYWVKDLDFFHFRLKKSFS